MDKELLYKYLKCLTSPQEEERIAAWLEASAENRAELNRIRLQLETLAFAAPAIDACYEQDRRRNLTIRLRRWCTAAAAAVILAAGVSYFTAQHVRTSIGGAMQTLTAQDGPVRLTLADGTSVWLNARTTLEYPAVFAGRQRTVRISGEAMFDVAHDETQPFVVETYACDVRVLGTKFNVSASESEGSFETALIRGRVEIRNRTTHETVTLHPDETVMLKNDRLVRSTIADPDDYLWTDGYVNLKGHTFEELIARYRKVFDVRIELDGVRMPDTRFKWGKICVKDGVDNAMKVLQNAYPITYTFDTDTRTIVVRGQ